MSNKKKKKLSVAEQKAEKYIYYGTIIGLVLGVILGFIGFILTDNNKKVVKKQPHKNK